MKLTTRLFAILILILATLVGADGYLEYAQERETIRDGLKRDASVLGRALGAILTHAWRTGGEGTVQQLIQDANQAEPDVRIRWVRFGTDPNDTAAPTARREQVEESVASGELIEIESSQGARLVSYVSVLTKAGEQFGLELSQSAGALSQRANQILQRSIVQLVVLFLVAAMTMYYVGVRMIGRHLVRHSEKIARVGHGDLTHTLHLNGAFELSQLAKGLNEMCEHLDESRRERAVEHAAKLTAIEEARHADRLRTVGTLAAGVAHELGTPLNVVGGRAAMIAERKLDESGVHECARIIEAQAERMTGIIRQLLTFARRSSTERSLVDMNRAVAQAVALVQSTAKKAGVAVSLRETPEAAPMVRVDASALQQVLTNLLMNAIQASPPGQTVEISIAIRTPNADDATAQFVRVEVRDSGTGIPEAQLTRIFEPFFTTKDVGHGTGLGLSIVHGILEDHGGQITVESEPGKGTRFHFYLPVSDS